MKDKIFSPKNVHKRIDEVGPWSYFFLSEIAFKYYYKWYAGLYEMNLTAAISAISKHEPDIDALIVRFQKDYGYHKLYKTFPKGYVNQW